MKLDLAVWAFEFYDQPLPSTALASGTKQLVKTAAPSYNVEGTMACFMSSKRF